MSTTITETFIGMDYPPNFHYSLSYYGSQIPWYLDAKKTTLVRNGPFFDCSFKFGFGERVQASAGIEVTMGFAAPSWSMSTKLTGGEVKADSMRVDIGENSVMGGVMFGAQVDLNVTFMLQQYIPGHGWISHWHPHWVPGHYDTMLNVEKNFSYDIIPLALDFVYGLIRNIKGFRKLAAFFPEGLLDNMSNYETGIDNKDGVFINPRIPLKWDVLFILRELAEIGAAAIANVLPGVGMAAVLAVTSVGDDLIEMEQTTALSWGAGFEFSLVFPVKVRITALTATAAGGASVTYPTLQFDGSSITGSDPTGDTATFDPDSVEKIGYHCEHTLELFNLQFGLWSVLAMAKVFRYPRDEELNLLEILEQTLGIDLILDLKSYPSYMNNEIGNLAHDVFGDRVDTIEYGFL